jgi:lipopolysaccharide export system protein LptA
MQLSIQRLRWVLIAGALLLVVVLAAFIGYGRYRALKTYSQLLKRNGISVTHETDGLTISQSLQGKTNFTIHSAKAVQLGDGKWLLHDAVMTFYGRVPNAVDHLYGSEVEYDEKLGVARAKGEVHMDLQAPQALAGSGHAHADNAPPVGVADDALIHVRTSGLVYLRKLGVAATDQPVEFRYGSVLCTARGAEFNPGQSTLRLLADVVMNAQMHGQPVQVTAVRADMDRTMNIANLTLPVVTSLGRTARADAAALTLRPDGSIERVQAGGHVVFHAGTRQMTAARLDATLSAQTVPQTARLAGGVLLTDDDPRRPMHGSAPQVGANFNEQGAPTRVTASGGAMITMSDKRTAGMSGGAGLVRELHAEKIVAMFAQGAKHGTRSSTQLRQVAATGAAKVCGESASTPHKGVASGALKSTLVAGDELLMGFATSGDGRAQPQTLLATGHTLLQQDAPLHEEQSSTGDKLEMSFAPASKPAAQKATQDEFAISSAVQTGHVAIRDHAPDRTDAKPGISAEGSVSTGGGERAVYDGNAQTLTLTGGAHLTGDHATLTAQRVVMNRESNVSEAFGDVHTTLENAAGAAAKPQSATHVLAASARFEHDSKLATFRGTDAQPARLWHEASQVQAANLILDGEHHTFSARPGVAGTMIHAVFAGAPAKPTNRSSNKLSITNIVRVASPRMDYNDVQREAIFAGGVQIDGTLGEVRSQRALVYLTPEPPGGEKKPATMAQPTPFNGSLDHVVVLGDVQLEQPGRHGSGEQMLYTAATGDYVLTGTAGHPPHVVDAQQGSVTGTTLTFGGQGSTIVVAGVPGSTTAKHERVRTDTEVRQ